MSFLSTHPTTADRIARVQALAARHPVAAGAAPLDAQGWQALRESLPPPSDDARFDR
jgi:hypothetical protein